MRINGRSCGQARVRWAGFVVVLAVAIHLAGCAQRESAAAESGKAREESVRFSSANITLAGTLVLPAGAAPRPAVVLFHGSGPQSRDLFTARWFAEQGFAALAYDKRGVGQSGGDFRSGPFMELCDDGLAAIAYLKSRKEIDPKRIGVWGLSQGGWLGPLAASRSPDVAFVIAVSGPGVSPGEQMIVYYANELRAQGSPEGEIQQAGVLRREIYNYLFIGTGYEKAKQDLDQARTKPWFKRVDAQQDRLFEPLQTPSELATPRISRFAREMHYD